MNFKRIAIIGAIALLSGCATQGGQNLDPAMQLLAPKLKVLDFDAKTYIDAAAACNAGAAKNYNEAMVLCANPMTVVSQIPGNPFVTTAQMTAVITAKCQIDGFLPSMAQTIQQTTCPVATPTPAAK